MGKLIFFNWLQLQFWFIMLASMFWIGYIVYRVRLNKSMVNWWGFRREGFRESVKLIGPLAVIALILFIIYGFKSGKMILSWHILPSLILYPIWGTIQQFLIMTLLAGNLDTLKNRRVPRYMTIFITAFVFGIVHFPYYLLIGGTFLLAIIYALVYLKHRNLWVLGLFHGWLGSFFYFFVLGRDAWTTFVESIW
jgi:membrane protease YdiL (CAAX protease family)